MQKLRSGRLLAVGVAGLVTLGLAALPEAASAAPAVATGRAVPMADGSWYCHNIGNGNLCARFINDLAGVDVRYTKGSGSPVTADLQYRDGGTTYNDNGSFTLTAGHTASFAWNYTHPDPYNCVRGVLRLTNGTTYTTDCIGF